MIYTFKDKEIDLSRVTRLYPAAVVKAGEEYAQVSLEWAELKQESVRIEHYVLVFDIDPLGEIPKNRIEFLFTTKEELLAAINDVARYL